MLCHAPTGAPGLCHLCHNVPFLCRSIPLPYPTYQPTLALPYKAFPLNSFRDFQYTTRTLRILHRFTLWQSVLCSVTPWTRIFDTVSRPSPTPPSHQCSWHAHRRAHAHANTHVQSCKCHFTYIYAFTFTNTCLYGHVFSAHVLNNIKHFSPAPA